MKALTGGSIEIPTLDGREISIPINEIVRWVSIINSLFMVTYVTLYSEGHCKKVIGEGMPLVDDPEKRGNMLIKFHIQFPHSLRPGQKNLIKQALQ